MARQVYGSHWWYQRCESLHSGEAGMSMGYL
jgi:hypothetical protein